MTEPSHFLASDSPLTRRLLEILELGGYALERLPKLGQERPGVVAHARVFRSFDDPYLIDLAEGAEGAPAGMKEWKEFRARLEQSKLDRGVLVSKGGFDREVALEAKRDPAVALFTFDELLADLIDFTPYLRNVVGEWESDPLHSGEFILPARAAKKAGDESFELDPYVDEWLAAGDRDPLFVLGRYGSGKTTFVKRLCARLAHAYLKDPVNGRVPVLVPLREYANLAEMDELIVSRIAELAPDQAPPSRRAFRVLLEAGRFCLVLDGLDELIRRLEPNYVIKHFDKICSLVIPGTKAMITAREGYLGSPEDEAQILGLGKHAENDKTRFERLYLEAIDPKDIHDYIAKRYPDRAEHYQMVVETRSELLELAKVPLLLELMLRSLPLLEGRLYVNPAVIMTAFIDSWAELGRARRPVLQTAEDAIFFATELAWQMHWLGVYKVHFTELSGRIKQRFRDRIAAIDAPDPFRADLADCPFLKLDADGNYAFVQNAFLDYLAALAVMRQLLDHGTAQIDSRRANPDMQRFVRDLATMDERYLKAYYKLLDELGEREDPTQWLFFRDLLPLKEKSKMFSAERERVREMQLRERTLGPTGTVFVPGGSFILGSTEHRDEMPVRRTKIPPFFIDVHPVTNAQYLEFLEATEHRRPMWLDEGPLAWVDGRYPDGTENFPVTLISYEDAQAYADWAGKRLPSEQEWELAARGYEGRRYPWGDEFDPELVTGYVSGHSELTAVGRHANAASVFGCLDMSGLVWEWTSTRYDRFQGLLELQVMRGGSFQSNPDELRCANRMFWAPDSPKADIGFRCAMSAV